jgi:hypothetical protein
MRFSMGLCFVIILTSLPRAGAQGPQSAPQPAPAKHQTHPTMENHISLGQLTPTPEMWFHEQAMRERSDPRAMVRQKAEFDTVQRQRRMAARAWYGVSAGRPAANITPLAGGGYSPSGLSPMRSFGSSTSATYYSSARAMPGMW